MIEDIGAMHGTHLNQKQLTPQKPYQLNSDDKLVFGAEVRRGQEIFPACTFKITTSIVYERLVGKHSGIPSKDLQLTKVMKRSPEPQMISYTPAEVLEKKLKESSNTFRCPEDSELDEDDIYKSDGEEAHHAGTSSEDDGAHRFTSDPIDLTLDSDSSTSSRPSVFSIKNGTNRHARVTASPNLSAPTRGTRPANQPIFLDDDSEEEYEPEAHCGDVDNIIEEDDASCVMHEDNDSGYSIDHTTQDVEIIIHDSEEMSPLDQEEEAGGAASEITGDFGEDSSSEVVGLGHKGLNVSKDKANEASGQSEDECIAQGNSRDSYSCIDLVDDFNNTSGGLFGLQEIDDQRSEPDSLFEDEGDEEGTSSELHGRQSTSLENPAHDTPNRILAITSLISSDYARQPSPSDAAMPRRTHYSPVVVLAGQSTSSTNPVGHTPWRCEMTAEKAPILETMYANKATLLYQKLQEDSEDVMNKISEIEKRHNNLPFTSVNSEHNIIPEFEESSMKAACGTPTSRLSPPLTPGSPRKRKADHISVALEEETAAWSKEMGDFVEPELTLENFHASSATYPEQAVGTENITAFDSVTTTEPRPTKKLKRFVEAAGYAALGAVAAGAGLFSLLVATAPDFV